MSSIKSTAATCNSVGLCGAARLYRKTEFAPASAIVWPSGDQAQARMGAPPRSSWDGIPPKEGSAADTLTTSDGALLPAQ